MSGKIICGVDESQAARAAVLVAKSLAHALERRLVLLHAVGTSVPYGVAAIPHAYPVRTDSEAPQRAAEGLLERLAYDFALAESVERRIEYGDPSLVLPAAAEDESAGLIVVGTGRRSRVASIFANVATAVVAHAPCPVVVVPPGGRLGSGALVCAVDDSHEARAALRVARTLADILGVALVLGHVVARAPVPSASAVPDGPSELAAADRRRAEELLAGLAVEQALGTAVERRVAFGSEAEAIADLADAEDAALVVVGSRGRGALKSFLVGSVSFELRTTSGRPIVVVPRGADAAFL